MNMGTPSNTRCSSKDSPWGKRDVKIYYYCVETGTLTECRTRDVYAELDLYKDPSNPHDVGGKVEIEGTLSKLESTASKSVALIHRELERRDNNHGGRMGGPPPSLTMKRRQLENLRKFMFIMYYHQRTIGNTYFQADHPGNVKSRSWIEAYRKRYGLLDSPQHVWLHVLRYYLNTPHNEIFETGSNVERNRFLASAPKHMVRDTGPESAQEWQDRYSAMEVDPESDDWRCFGYYTQMGMFLAIWEAAPGEEFVMSDTSFGLYEGNTDSAGPLHKFFVVSPKIVLVLCHPGLKQHDTSAGFINIFNPYELQPGDLSTSMLLTAPHKGAKIKYAKSPSSSQNFTVMYGNPGAQTPSPEDDFELEISRLSQTETHTVNAIILGNLHDNGKLTFGSRAAALRTIANFTVNNDFSRTSRIKLFPLARLLAPPNPPEIVGARDPQLLAPSPGSLWSSNFEVYRRLQTGNDVDSERFRYWVELYSRRWPLAQGLPPRLAALVASMNDHLARMTFRVCDHLVDWQGADLRDEWVYGPQMLMAFLEHLLHRRRDIFLDLQQRLVGMEEMLAGPNGWRGGRTIMVYTDVCVSNFVIYILLSWESPTDELLGSASDWGSGTKWRWGGSGTLG